MPHIYSGEEIQGRVIDKDTKQPIQGVVVVAAWELEGGIFIADHSATVHIAETLTDANGFYTIPEWGPKLTIYGKMIESMPLLIFYKFGYNYRAFLNTISGNMHIDNSISEQTGKTVELQYYGELDKNYTNKIFSLYDVLSLNSPSKHLRCLWTKVPIFTSEMVKLSHYLTSKHIEAGYLNLGDLRGSGCENPEEILKGYLQ